jgi:hypothetical protein
MVTLLFWLCLALGLRSQLGRIHILSIGFEAFVLGAGIDVQDLPTTRLDTNDYWILLSAQRPMTGFIGVRGEGSAA